MKSAIKKYIPFALGQKLRGLWQKTMSVYYRGDKYHCPYCEKNFRMLLTGGFDLPAIKKYQIIGGGRRENMVCPRCYSTDRDRLLFLYFNYKSDLLKSRHKVLHVAPSGALKAYLSKQANLVYQTGTKHHEGFYYSKNIELIDITKLSFNDNSFDVVICNHVLEHITDDISAIKEIYRVLKPGGWAILQVPYSKIIPSTIEDSSVIIPSEREKHFGQFDHVRIYGPDYPERLQSVGFKVNMLNPLKDDWNLPDLEKYAINKEEDVYVAFK